MNANIEKIISDYLNTKSVWKTGELNGISGQKAHSILKKNNISTKKETLWSNIEIEELKVIYSNGFSVGDSLLDRFCKKHNRLKSNVCRKAKELGLETSYNRNLSDEAKNNISIKTTIRFKRDIHPKGMLGKTHSKVTKENISKSSKIMWSNPSSKVNTDEHRQLLSDRFSKNQNIRMKNNPSSVYSKGKKGTISIGGKVFFARSSWEANIAAYFEFLKSKEEIKEWEHEPNTFWFLEIKRGVRSYLPDFLITRNDGTQYYEEVKGWMDNKSKTKLNRMRIYYPNIEISVLDQKRYNDISKNKSIIPNWGLLDSGDFVKSVKVCSVDGCGEVYHSKKLCRKHHYLKYKR